MWEDYCARVQAARQGACRSPTRRPSFPDLRRYQLVILDESHNLRNREGARYRAIHEYIRENDCRCILLSATPYNKTYLDLSSQIRLFQPEDTDIGVRPERLLKEIGETEFIRKHQCGIRDVGGIREERIRGRLARAHAPLPGSSNAQLHHGQLLPDRPGERPEVPDRLQGRAQVLPGPRAPDGEVRGQREEQVDQYARLFSPKVVDAVNALQLPRYGLGNYISKSPAESPSAAEKQQLENLSKAGKRLMGFCRTNLFKRLESSGSAFVQSVERHLLRNYVWLAAIEEGCEIPLGTQDVVFARSTDSMARRTTRRPGSMTSMMRARRTASRTSSSTSPAIERMAAHLRR